MNPVFSASLALPASWALLASLAWVAAGCGEDDVAKPNAAADTTAAAADTIADTAADTAVAPAQQRTLTLVDGDGKDAFVVDIDADALRITLKALSEATPRTSLPLKRLRFGLVAAWDVERNYDPDLLDTHPPDGLSWAAIAKMTAIAAPAGTAPAGTAPAGTAADGAHYRLDTHLLDAAGAATPSAGPTYVLSVHKDVLRAAITLQPLDAALTTAWDADSGNDRVVYVQVVADAPAGEGYYGLGEFMDAPQHRGKKRTTQLKGDFGLDGSSNEGHVRVPLLVSTGGWGLFLRTYRPTVFDVAASDKTAIVATSYAHTLQVELLAATDAIDVVGTYWRSTGAPMLPAPWAVGGLIWRNENVDQAEVLADAKALRDHDLALSGLWIDRPYDVAVNDFGFDPARYPDPPAMVKTLHAGGLRVGLWSTPYLDPGYNGKATAKHYAEAESKGYFVTGPGAKLKLLKWGPPIDFTKPEAAAFFTGLIDGYTALGIEGYKLDYGEDIVLGLLTARIPWYFGDGSDERTMHRRFYLGYHAAYAAHMPALDGLKGGGFLLARASAWGDQAQTSMIWPGDLCAIWEGFGHCSDDGKCHAGGLPASLAASISLPTAGFPLFGADTGGYRHGRASKELFLRWLQHTALSGVLQIGGGTDHHPWLSEPIKNPYAPGSAFDAETLDVARAAIRLHARLFPVIWSDLRAAHDHFRGVGPVRALGLSFPALAGEAALLAHDGDQHLFGDHLLVAPVITQANEREVFFPPGTWVDVFDGSVHTGAAKGSLAIVQAPLHKLPLYQRAGTVLPLLRPDVDTLATSTDPGVVSFVDTPGLLYAEVRLGGESARAKGDKAGHTALWDGTALHAYSDGSALALSAVAGPATTAVFAEGVVWVVSGRKQAATSVQVGAKDLAKADLSSGGVDPDLGKAVVACPAACWAQAGGVLYVRAAFDADAVTVE